MYSNLFRAVKVGEFAKEVKLAVPWFPIRRSLKKGDLPQSLWPLRPYIVLLEGITVSVSQGRRGFLVLLSFLSVTGGFFYLPRNHAWNFISPPIEGKERRTVSRDSRQRTNFIILSSSGESWQALLFNVLWHSQAQFILRNLSRELIYYLPEWWWKDDLRVIRLLIVTGGGLILNYLESFSTQKVIMETTGTIQLERLPHLADDDQATAANLLIANILCTSKSFVQILPRRAVTICLLFTIYDIKIEDTYSGN